MGHGASVKGPGLRRVLCLTEHCCHSEILSNFIFELVVYKGDSMGCWSMNVSRGDTHKVHAHCSLMCHLSVTFVMPMSTEVQWTQTCGSLGRLKVSTG